MKIKKVAIFGNQTICVKSIDFLIKNGIDIDYVVGCEKETDKIFGYASVEKYCEKLRIEYYKPEKLDHKFMKLILGRSELAFSLYYRKIIPEVLINSFHYGIINLHSSLLPKYRGPVPTMWGLLNGEKEFGLTLHYIDSGVDTGDIISQIKFKVDRPVSGYDLNNITMEYGLKLFKREISKILNLKNSRKRQDSIKATYYGKYKTKIRNIDWYQNRDLINRKVLAFARPYLGALARVGDSTYIFWESKPLLKRLKTAGGPGRIVEFDRSEFVVTTVDGYLKIKKYEKIKGNTSLAKGIRFDL